MADITQLILDDHETFRREFARNTSLDMRVDLGHQFLKFKTDHSA